MARSRYKLFYCSPSVGLRRQLPRKRWRLIVRFISLHIKPALKGEVAMSVSELTEGLKKKVASLGIVNPSVGYADSSP